MDDSEIVQSVIEIFFGQLSSNKDKTNAKEAAKQILQFYLLELGKLLL